MSEVRVDHQEVPHQEPDAGLNSVEATLADRQGKYGDFAEVARLSNEIRGAIFDGEAYPRLSVEHTEVLILISLKIARIVCGDPNLKDNWHDIAGYATLAERACK